MLYSQLVLAIVLLTTHSVLSDKFQEVSAACAKESGFTGDIQKIDFSDPAITTEAKCAVACVLDKKGLCAVACVLDKKGLFKPDGSIDREKDRTMLQELIKDEELKNKYIKAIDECDGSAKTNKCETAYEYLKCFGSKVGPE